MPAVRAEDDSLQIQFGSYDAALDTNRGVAPGAKAIEQRSLGSHAETGRTIVQSRKNLSRRFISLTGLDPQCALADGSKHYWGNQPAADTRCEPQPFQAGRRENQGVEFSAVELPQPGIDIPAGFFENQVRTQMQELRPPTEASRPNFCPVGQGRQLAGTAEARRQDERIRGFLALWNGRKFKARGGIGGEVLEAVNVLDSPGFNGESRRMRSW